jgi:hypothetical protein
MSKHTPGPWTWGENYNGLYGSGKDNEVLTFASYEGMYLSYSNKYTHGNARLIAAAPDLLEALKEMLEMWEDKPLYGADIAGKAYAAIAKAEGKE